MTQSNEISLRGILHRESIIQKRALLPSLRDGAWRVVANFRFPVVSRFALDRRLQALNPPGSNSPILMMRDIITSEDEL